MFRFSFFSAVQVLLGLAGTALVIFSFMNYRQPLYDALNQMDLIAEKAENELKTTSNLIASIDKVSSSIQKSIPEHKKTIVSFKSAVKSTTEMADKWEKEIPGFQDMAKDGSKISNTLASQLPIRVPAIDVKMKTISFKLPEIIPKMQRVEVPYPTATVTNSNKELKYPMATVEKKKIEHSFGSVAGRNLGGINFEYPSGIKISEGTITLTYPSSISIGSAVKAIEVPNTPEIKLKDYSFDFPENAKIVYRELMNDEKKLLEKSSKQLETVIGSLEKTKEAISTIKALIGGEVSSSLDTTIVNLSDAEKELANFRGTVIPSVLDDLKKQATGVNQSRKVFTVISGLIPLGFLILGLITLSISLSGIQKASRQSVAKAAI